MADDILNIVVKLGGDWQKFEDVLQKPINLKLNASFGKEIEKFLSIDKKELKITVNTSNADKQLKTLYKQLQDIQDASVITIKGKTAAVQQRNVQRALLQQRGVSTIGISNAELEKTYQNLLKVDNAMDMIYRNQEKLLKLSAQGSKLRKQNINDLKQGSFQGPFGAPWINAPSANEQQKSLDAAIKAQEKFTKEYFSNRAESIKKGQEELAKSYKINELDFNSRFFTGGQYKQQSLAQIKDTFAQQTQADQIKAIKQIEAARKASLSPGAVEQSLSQIKAGFTSQNNKQLLDNQKKIQEAQLKAIKQAEASRIAGMSPGTKEQSLDEIKETFAKIAQKDATTQAIERFKSNQSAKKLQQLNQAAQLQQFRQDYNLKEANLEFQRSPFFDKGARERIAYSRGILPSQLTSNRSFIDPGRLKEPGVAREIAFATLFGRGLFGKAAGFAGGIAGASIGGPGGALLGAAGAQLAVEGLSEVFEKLAQVMEMAGEKGIQFQQSVIAISASLNATTELLDVNTGRPLDTISQIQGQQRLAEGYQLAARQNLLPLGIGGEVEVAYAKALGAGLLGRKGIRLSAEQFGKFAGALGGAQIALDPVLSSNPTRAFRDIRDIIQGTPNAKNTEFGAALGDLTKEIGNARTVQDIERLTEKLNKFREAVENSDRAAVQLLRVQGSIDKIFTSVGDAYKQAQTPGIRAKANALSSPALENFLASIGAGLGFKESVEQQIQAGLLNIVNAFLGALEKAAANLEPQMRKLFEGTLKPFFKGLGVDLGEFEDTSFAKFIGLKPKDVLARIRQRLESQLQIIYEDLEINPTDSFSKRVTNNPFFRGRKLSEAANLIGGSQLFLNGDLHFINQFQELAFQQFENVEKKFNLQRSTLDTTPLAGQRANLNLTEQELGGKQELINTLVEANKRAALAAKTDIEKERVKSAEELISILQGQVNAGKSKLVGDRIQFQGLEISTFKKLGDALKQLGEAAQDQADKFRDLSLSLKITQANLDNFSTNLKSAFASKEEEILNKAQKVYELNGTTGSGFLDAIVSDPSLMQEYIAKAAAGDLNSTLAAVGLSPASNAGSGATDFVPKQGGVFQLGLEADKNALLNTMKETNRDLADLDRSFKNLNDTLQNTIKYLQYLLGNGSGASPGGSGSLPGGSLPGQPGSFPPPPTGSGGGSGSSPSAPSTPPPNNIFKYPPQIQGRGSKFVPPPPAIPVNPSNLPPGFLLQGSTSGQTGGHPSLSAGTSASPDPYLQALSPQQKLKNILQVKGGDPFAALQYLQSLSNNPAVGDIGPVRDLLLQQIGMQPPQPTLKDLLPAGQMNLNMQGGVPYFKVPNTQEELEKLTPEQRDLYLNPPDMSSFMSNTLQGYVDNPISLSEAGKLENADLKRFLDKGGYTLGDYINSGILTEEQAKAGVGFLDGTYDSAEEASKAWLEKLQEKSFVPSLTPESVTSVFKRGGIAGPASAFGGDSNYGETMLQELRDRAYYGMNTGYLSAPQQGKLDTSPTLLDSILEEQLSPFETTGPSEGTLLDSMVFPKLKEGMKACDCPSMNLPKAPPGQILGNALLSGATNFDDPENGFSFSSFRPGDSAKGQAAFEDLGPLMNFGSFPAMDAILKPVNPKGQYLATSAAASLFGLGDAKGKTSVLDSNYRADAKGIQAYTDIAGAFIDSNLNVDKGRVSPPRPAIPNANLQLSRYDNQLFNLDQGGGAEEFKSQKGSKDNSLLNAVQKLPSEMGMQFIQALQVSFSGS